MGVHSGPVTAVTDVNDTSSVAGAEINMAQRVMDCGDAGHILLSRHVAEDLEQYAHWKPHLHDVVECKVKHGAKIGIANLYSDEAGNRQLPKKFQALKKHRSRVRWAEAAIGFLVVAAIVAAFLLVLHRPMRQPLSAAEKSIAVLPFVNMSGDGSNNDFSDGITEEILNALFTDS
jgi:hypothetical protein